MNWTMHVTWTLTVQNIDVIVADRSLLDSFPDPDFFSTELSSMIMTKHDLTDMIFEPHHDCHWLGASWSSADCDSSFCWGGSGCDPELLIPLDLLPLPEFIDLLKHEERLDDDTEQLKHLDHLNLQLKLLDARSLAVEVWELFWYFLKLDKAWDEVLIEHYGCWWGTWRLTAMPSLTSLMLISRKCAINNFWTKNRGGC